MDKIDQALDNFFQRLGHTPGPWEFTNDPDCPKTHAELIESAAKGQGEDSIIYHGADWYMKDENSRLITQSPAMLRTLCRTYLWFLTNLTYGTPTAMLRIRSQEILAGLVGQISEATGIEHQQVQETFEQYATWISLDQGIPVERYLRESTRQVAIDPPDPETSVFRAMQEGAD